MLFVHRSQEFTSPKSGSASRESAFVGLEALKIVKIRSLTPPIACESKQGPALKQEQVFESIEVRVSLLVNEELYSARPREIIPQTRVQALPACYNESTAVRARKANNLTFVDEDLAPRAIPDARVRVRTSKVLDVRQALSSCRRRKQEPSTK